MYVVLTTLYARDNPGIVDWLGIGDVDPEPRAGSPRSPSRALVAALWVFAQLRAGAVVTLAARARGEARAAGRPRRSRRRWPAAGRWADDPGGGLDGGGELEPGPVVADGERCAAGGVGGGHGPVDGVARRPPRPSPRRRPSRCPTWSEPPTLAEVGVRSSWFRAEAHGRARSGRIARRRSTDEPGGRLDRLDLWILVVLVVGDPRPPDVPPRRAVPDALRRGLPRPDGDGVPAGLALRHSHDIYEWTHPHLAKYAMAGGLVAWGDDRVSATSDLGVPVRDAVIEPRRDDPAPDRRPRRRSRRRRHGLRAPLVRPARPEPRRHGRRSRARRALAYDDVGYRLFVGTDDGQILDVRRERRSTASRARSSRPLVAAALGVRPRRRRRSPSSTRAATAGRSSSRRRTAGSSRSTPTRPRRSATVQLAGIAGVRAGRHGPGRRDAGGRGRGPGGRRGGPRRRSSAATRRPTRRA